MRALKFVVQIPPLNPKNGDLFYSAPEECFRVYTKGTWQKIVIPDVIDIEMYEMHGNGD